MRIIGKYLGLKIGYNSTKRTIVRLHLRTEAHDRNMDKSNTRSELKAFCEDSSIYGLKYFVHSRRPWERLFWISFLILGIALSVVIVRKSLIDWEVCMIFGIFSNHKFNGINFFFRI